MLSCFICPHSIMDNTLVYEAGDCGSIPYVGAKFCKCQQEKSRYKGFFEGLI